MKKNSLNKDGRIISVEMPTSRIIGILLGSALLFVAAISLWNQQRLDQSIVIYNNFVYENDLYLQLFKYVSRYGMGILAICYSFLILITMKKQPPYQNRNLFMLVLFSFAFGSIAGDLLKELIGRARPAEAMAGKIILTALSDTSSFPSGHAAKSMGLALPFVIMAAGRDATTVTFKILFSVFAILVCYSRIALQKHYLSDVLAGAGTALLFIIAAAWVVNRLYRKRNIDEKKLTGMNKIFGGIFALLAILLVSI